MNRLKNISILKISFLYITLLVNKSHAVKTVLLRSETMGTFENQNIKYIYFFNPSLCVLSSYIKSKISLNAKKIRVHQYLWNFNDLALLIQNCITIKWLDHV